MTVRQLPRANEAWDKSLRTGWNELIRILEQDSAHRGLIGVNYKVCGTPPTSATLDLASVTTTAVAQMLGKLINDLARRGFLSKKGL